MRARALAHGVCESGTRSFSRDGHESHPRCEVILFLQEVLSAHSRRLLISPAGAAPLDIFLACAFLVAIDTLPNPHAEKDRDSRAQPQAAKIDNRQIARQPTKQFPDSPQDILPRQPLRQSSKASQIVPDRRPNELRTGPLTVSDSFPEGVPESLPERPPESPQVTDRLSLRDPPP